MSSAEDVFFLFVEIIQMYFNFSSFYVDKIERKVGHESDLSARNSEAEGDNYETTVCLSRQEVHYMKQFDKSYCFLITFPGEFIENKALLSANLQNLKKFIETAIGFR